MAAPDKRGLIIRFYRFKRGGMRLDRHRVSVDPTSLSTIKSKWSRQTAPTQKLPPRSTARTPASGAGYRGSNPWGAAKSFPSLRVSSSHFHTVWHLARRTIYFLNLNSKARVVAALSLH